MPQILPATIKDIPIVAAIETQLYPQPWSQKDFEDLFAQKPFWFWVAKKENEIVGYLAAQVVKKEAELHNIAVAKEYQRQGVGKFLLQKLVAALQEKGVHELYLMVRASNTPAQKLYEHVGFKKTGVRKNYYQPQKENAWVYQLVMG